MRRPVTAVHSIAQVIMGLSQRRFGDPSVSRELGMPVAGESLSEVARGRGSRILDLIAEPAIVSSAGLINKFVHLLLQLVRKLPGNEFIISAHSHDPYAGNARAACLRTRHPAPGTWHSTRHQAPGTVAPEIISTS